MKKQDLVNTIEQMICLLKDQTTNQEIAEKIVDKLHHLGLLPPTIELSHIKAKDNAWED